MWVKSIAVALATLVAAHDCPFMGGGDLPAGHPRKFKDPATYREKLGDIDFQAVKEDLKQFMVKSQDFWPADYGNYGPLFIRLAWHCSGSYRRSDGRGGCDGGRMRFDPERSWADNTNLDKARRVLWPIKKKYGPGLSYGDLYVLAGTAAIEQMGGPVLGFCGGRIDSPNGDESMYLGPSQAQEAVAPCDKQGECDPPLGTTTVGLIYLNPEGPNGVPDPVGSAKDVRDAFNRMAMNSSETVALVGGGHAFGKMHGPCPAGPGEAPKDNEKNPWQGGCGSGMGVDTFTSGFEGPWTRNPTKWDNEYFSLLVNNKWEVRKSPGGPQEWWVKDGQDGNSRQAPNVDGKGKQRVVMTTADFALWGGKDKEFMFYTKLFMKFPSKLDTAFSHAWYKLTTRDMGPVTRCVGNLVPPAQPFQNPLPPPQEHLSGEQIEEAREMIATMIENNPMMSSQLFRLAWRCAATFRQTDYMGGCNGARIRFDPEASWPVNRGLKEVLYKLKPIKAKFGARLSYADLIVLAGNTAIEEAGGPELPFCPGRTDADGPGVGFEDLAPPMIKDVSDLMYFAAQMGLTDREVAVIHGVGKTFGIDTFYPVSMNSAMKAESGGVDNSFFVNLISPNAAGGKVTNRGVNCWIDCDKKGGKCSYCGTAGYCCRKGFQDCGAPNAGCDKFHCCIGNPKPAKMDKMDMFFKFDAKLLDISIDLASDNELFLEEFTAAWTRLMTIDRYDGPLGNVCDTDGDVEDSHDEDSLEGHHDEVTSMLGTIIEMLGGNGNSGKRMIALRESIANHRGVLVAGIGLVAVLAVVAVTWKKSGGGASITTPLV